MGEGGTLGRIPGSLLVITPVAVAGNPLGIAGALTVVVGIDGSPPGIAGGLAVVVGMGMDMGVGMGMGVGIGVDPPSITGLVRVAATATGGVVAANATGGVTAVIGIRGPLPSPSPIGPAGP